MEKIKRFFKKMKGERKFSVLYLILGVVLAVYAVSFLLMLAWAVSTSFKDPVMDYSNGNTIWLPRLSVWENGIKDIFNNYKEVLTDGFKVNSNKFDSGYAYFVDMLFVSFAYGVGNALVQVTVTFIVAYAAARFKFIIGEIIYTIVIVGMILPIVGSQPSAIALARALNLNDSILGMYVHKFTFLGMYFLVFHATLKAYPKDFDEAAQIDGASNLSVMLRVIWPLNSTTYFTVLLLVFVAQWNDYSTPMLFMPNLPTLAYGLRSVETNGGMSGVPARMAACFLAALPTLTLFVIFHDRLMTNISLGGVKE